MALPTDRLASDVNAASDDEVLGGIFGADWRTIFSSPANESQGIVEQLLSIFSLTISAGVAFVLLVVFIVAVIKTSNKGTLGEEYSSSLFPVRAFVGPMLMFPFSGGYSILQGIVLTAVVAIPVGTANFAAGELADAILIDSKPFSNVGIVRTPGLTQNLFLSTVCQAYFNRIEYPNRESTSFIDGPPFPDGDNSFNQGQTFFEYIGNGFWPKKAWRFDFNRKDAASNNGGRIFEQVCGSYTVSCIGSNTAEATLCRSQAESFHKLYQGLIPLANQVVDGGPLPELSQLAALEAAYEDEKQVSVAAAIRIAIGQDGVDARENLIEDIKRNGFFGLGGFHMTFIQTDRIASEYGANRVTFTPNNFQNVIDADVGISQYLNRALSVIDASGSGYIPSNEQDSNAEGDRIRALTLQVGNEFDQGPRSVRFWSDVGDFLTPTNDDPGNLSPVAGQDSNLDSVFDFRGNPLNGLQSLGNTLLTSSSALLTYIALAGDSSSSKSKGGGLEGFFKGLKGKADKLSQSSTNGARAFLSLLTTMLFITMALGALLLYYLPFVPFILWVSAVTGYLIAIYEYLAGTTLWMASMVMPGGSGLSSEHARPGFGYGINIIIRPILMVIGLAVGTAIFKTVVSFFVPFAYSFAVSVMSNRLDIVGLFSFLAVHIILIAIIIIAYHRSYSTVFESPDNITRIITTNVRPQNEQSDESRLSGAVVGAANRIEQSGTAGAGGAPRGSRPAPPAR